MMVAIFNFLNLQPVHSVRKNGPFFGPALWYFEGESRDKLLLTNKMHKNKFKRPTVIRDTDL